MPAATLTARFARRMVPAALFAGLTLALLPPVVYLASWGVTEQADSYARHFAAAVASAAYDQPRLWRYDVHKVVQATAGHRGQLDIGTVEVRDCAGRLVFSSRELEVGTGRTAGPVGRAPVVVHGHPIATVQVRLDPAGALQATAWIGLLSLALGAALVLVLLRYPTSVVRSQAVELEQTLIRLRRAEEGLVAANRDLAGQVQAAVQEVRTLSARVVEVQEEERARIARELHDGVGQALTALQIDLTLAEQQPAVAGEHLRRARRQAAEALLETRQAVADLQPGELQRLGLVGALQALAERFEQRTGVATAFRASGSFAELSASAARALFRILQEALTNVSRHAQAHEVGILLSREAGWVRLRIQDDGRGLPAAVRPGAGLTGMMERARFLGGTARLGASPGEGTWVEVELPLDGPAAPAAPAAPAVDERPTVDSPRAAGHTEVPCSARRSP